MSKPQYLLLIPCFNEEENITSVLLNLEKYSKYENFDILAINDGSTDSTLEKLTNENSIDYILSSNNNKGLSSVFTSAQKFFLSRNYDFLIIYDCDSQYPSKEIETLIKMSEFSDIVIGCRSFKKNKHFSKTKNILQIVGSKVVSWIAGIKVSDVTSGFRIFNRHALENIVITNNFTYTVESILQSKTYKLKVNTFVLQSFIKTRESRLFNSNLKYLLMTLKTISNTLLFYKEKTILKIIYLINFTIAGLSLSRFFIPYFLDGSNPGNIQSLIFGSLIITSTLLLNIIFNQKINMKQIESMAIEKSYPSHSQLIENK